MLINIKMIDNSDKLQNLVSLYNLNQDDIKIKYFQDYGIICTFWFVSISVNNIVSYGQAKYKDFAISLAIDNLSQKLAKT